MAAVLVAGFSLGVLRGPRGLSSATGVALEFVASPPRAAHSGQRETTPPGSYLARRSSQWPARYSCGKFASRAAGSRTGVERAGLGESFLLNGDRMVLPVNHRAVLPMFSLTVLVMGLVVVAGCSGNPTPSPGAAAPTQPPPTRPPASAVAVPSLSPSASPAAAGRTFTIEMTNDLHFNPAELTVPLGVTVVWKNASSVQHTSTDDPSKAADKSHAVLPPGAQPWDSGNIDPGKSFEHVFNVPGTYHYFCIPHEAAGMLGTIVVQG